MDLLINIISHCWSMLNEIAIPITMNGNTYNITLYAILMFTVIGGIAVMVLFNLFK